MNAAKPEGFQEVIVENIGQMVEVDTMEKSKQKPRQKRTYNIKNRYDCEFCEEECHDTEELVAHYEVCPFVVENQTNKK